MRAAPFALALALLAAPLAAYSQQPGTSYRIGYLGTNPPTTPDAMRPREALRQGLGELARPLRLQLQRLDARSPNDFDRAFDAMAREGANGLLVLVDSMFTIQKEEWWAGTG